MVRGGEVERVGTRFGRTIEEEDREGSGASKGHGSNKDALALCLSVQGRQNTSSSKLRYCVVWCESG